MPERLYFTESDEANALIASDPMALLVGFVLDQQVTVQKAFAGPLLLRERLGAFDAATLAAADLEPVFREQARDPPLPRSRWPSACTTSPSTCATSTTATPRGVWTDAADAAALRANLSALPGFGEMKVKALGSVLAKRFGVAGRAGARAVAPDARRRRLRRRRSPTTRPPRSCTRPSG